MDIIKKIFKIIYELIESFVVSASVFVVIYLFLMQPHQIKGSSMFPTFKNGEYLLTDKVTFKRRRPMRGDVIVFKSPMDENFDFIKRVIALPGETVSLHNGFVYLNGKQLDEPYLTANCRTFAERFLQEEMEYTVPEGAIVVMGDNRPHSSDSRDWGPVPYENIVGRAFFRYWPSDVMGLVVNPLTN